MTQSLPEVGTKVKVIKQVNGHQFPIGTWVEVYKSNPEYLYCQDQHGKQFGLTTEEFETID